MNIDIHPRNLYRFSSSIVAAFVLAAFCPDQFIFAQTAPPPIDDEIVELSPFVVNTSRDAGYVANTTLAGTRTNTEIKDIGNPIDIITAELMQDLNVHDIQDLTTLAMNVQPNKAGGYDAGGEGREVWNYNQMEIRGFLTNVLTRNFMDLNAQFESYNSERVEFSKGPNAILAGSGNPGGTINYSTKVPLVHKSKYFVEYQTDELGTQRVSADVNQVLVKDKLALRLNALWEDRDYYRHPSYQRQKAYHFTGQWRPFRSTTVTLGFERRKVERASPRSVFPNDWVTPWLSAGSPIVTGYVSSGMVTVDGAPVRASTLNMATVTSNKWLIDSDGVVRNARDVARGTQSLVNATGMDIIATGLDYPRDSWIGGPNSINDSDWRIFEGNITQRITNDLYVDLSYGNVINDVMQGNSVSSDLYIDPNNFGNNKHAGQMYIETQPLWIQREFNINHVRGTVSYNLDLRKINTWLGQHRFAGAVEYNRREEWQDNGRLVLYSTPSGPINPADYGSAGYTNASLYFYIREYLDPKNSKNSLRDMRDIYYSDGISKDGYTARYVRRDGYAARRTLTEQRTWLGVFQSRWLKDHLITTIGLRKDLRTEYIAQCAPNSVGIQVPIKLVDGAPLGATHPKYADIIDPGKKNSGISRNYGAVLHTWDWLSFTFGYSSNFSPRVESLDLYGNYVTPSNGESYDYGIRMNLFKNKLNISLIHYETEELNATTNGSSINSPFSRLQDIEWTLIDNNAILPNGQQLTRERIIGVFTTADRRAKGEELTIVGNPTPQWTFRLTASRLDNRQTNLAPDVRDWYNTWMPYYKSQPQTWTRSGNVVTLGTYIKQAEDQYALMNTRENVKVFPASEYTARLTAKYTFRNTSKLRGLALGASGRWDSAPIIAYYKTSLNGTAYFDPNRPHKDDAQTYLDLFISYRKRLFQKVEWSIQMNISNVFNSTDPMGIMAVNNVDAADYQWITYRSRPIDGRVISFRTSFAF